MADKKDETVEVDDEGGTITVDITDNPDLANVEGAGNVAGIAADGAVGDKDDEDVKVVAEPEKKKAEAKPEKKSIPRVRIDDKSVALQESLTSSEKARKAATEALTVEQQRRAAAEARANEASKAVVSAQEEAATKELSALTGQIEGTQRELSALEAELAKLYEAGEFAKAAATQTKIGRATAALDRLESSKSGLEAKVESLANRVETEVTPVDPTATMAPLDRYISSQNFAPEAQIWLRAHPDCVPPQFGGKQDMNAKMLAGHYDAMGKNIPTNTPEYFAIIEQHIGERKAAEDDPVDDVGDEEEVADAKPQKSPAKKTVKAQPSAPPSREAPSGGQIPRQTRQVTLTPQQQEHARLSFPEMTPQKAYATYARNLLELESEGKMGRLTH